VLILVKEIDMSDQMTDEEQEVAYGEKCNVCGTTWTKTQRVIGGHWFHCLPCGKKAEDLKGTKASSNSQLDMFEDAIEEIDWDDWSIFKLDEDAHSSYTGVDCPVTAPKGLDSTNRTITKAQRFEIAQELIYSGAISTSEEFIEFFNNTGVLPNKTEDLKK
jgi:hypothetical protein